MRSPWQYSYQRALLIIWFKARKENYSMILFAILQGTTGQKWYDRHKLGKRSHYKTLQYYSVPVTTVLPDYFTAKTWIKHILTQIENGQRNYTIHNIQIKSIKLSNPCFFSLRKRLYQKVLKTLHKYSHSIMRRDIRETQVIISTAKKKCQNNIIYYVLWCGFLLTESWISPWLLTKIEIAFSHRGDSQLMPIYAMGVNKISLCSLP